LHARIETKDTDAHDVKSECNMKIAPFKGVLMVGGARRQLKIGPFEEYFGGCLERVEGAYLFALSYECEGKKGWTSTPMM
jgi:hypothetical protein